MCGLNHVTVCLPVLDTIKSSIFFSQQVFCSPEPPAKTSTPEDFIRMTKGITMATAKAVAAGNSCRQEDVIATANLSRRAIADMLRACKVGMLVVRGSHCGDLGGLKP